MQSLILDLIEDGSKRLAELRERAHHGVEDARGVCERGDEDLPDGLADGDERLHHALDEGDAELHGFGDDVGDLLADLDERLDEFFHDGGGLGGEPGEELDQAAAEIAQRPEHGAHGADHEIRGGLEHVEHGLADGLDALNHFLEDLEAGLERAFDEVGDGLAGGDERLHEIAHGLDGPVDDVADGVGDGGDDVAHGLHDGVDDGFDGVDHGVGDVLDEADNRLVMAGVGWRDDGALAADHGAGLGEPTGGFAHGRVIPLAPGVEEEVLHQHLAVSGGHEADGVDDASRLAGAPHAFKGQAAIRRLRAGDLIEHAAEFLVRLHRVGERGGELLRLRRVGLCQLQEGRGELRRRHAHGAQLRRGGVRVV